MKLVMLALLAQTAACGSRGKAQPAEVEISWPDASVATRAMPASQPDAGLSQPPPTPAVDAGKTAELPQ